MKNAEIVLIFDNIDYGVSEDYLYDNTTVRVTYGNIYTNDILMTYIKVVSRKTGDIYVDIKVPAEIFSKNLNYFHNLIKG